MKTQVQQTSIQAYHSPDVQASIDGQRIRVAREIVRQTKAGKPSCIGSLWEHFNKAGDKALSEKSSVSRACNEIYHMGSIVVDGFLYDYKTVERKKYNGRLVNHFCLVLATVETGQIELF